MPGIRKMPQMISRQQNVPRLKQVAHRITLVVFGLLELARIVVRQGPRRKVNREYLLQIGYQRCNKRTTAWISPEMSCGSASAAGGQLRSRRVWLVIGPTEIAGTASSGKAMPALAAASARLVAVEELV